MKSMSSDFTNDPNIKIPENISPFEKIADNIKQETAYFRSLYEQAPLAYQSLDIDGKIITVNSAWLKALGYEREEVINKWFGFFLQEDDQAKFRENFPLFKAAGEIHEVEFEMLRKDGTTFFAAFDGVIATDDHGRFKSTHCIFYDITGRKQNEMVLKQERDYYYKILDNLPVAVHMSDATGKPIFVNETMITLSGRSLEEDQELKWQQFIHPDDLSEFIFKFQNALKENKPCFTEHRMLCHNRYRWVLGRANPFYDQSGDFAGFIGIIIDITERKKAEQEIARMKEITLRAEKMASLGTMAAGITHEVNQPLNSLKIIADSMLYWHKKGKNLDIEKVINNLHKISQQADRIDKIIKHMRLFIHKDNIGAVEKCNLNDIVEKSMELMRNQLSSHGIVVEKRLDQSLPSLYGEKIRLEEMVLNILVNAMDAMDLSGKKEKILIIETEFLDQIVLKISDNGIGIKEEIRDCLFDPFFTTKVAGAGSGMGIGLVIVHSVITSLSGDIEVKNNDMGGATFIITLPTDRRRVTE